MRFRVKNPSGTSKNQIRQRTRRKAPVSTQELIDQINPVARGWGQYYCKAHVRKLFHQLDGWIVRRLWSHRHKRWRNAGWKQLPESKLIGEYGLVRLITLDSVLEPSLRHLCESGLRENCTSRLSGGRRPAPTGASSDPTPLMPGNAGGGKHPYFWCAFDGEEAG